MADVNTNDGSDSPALQGRLRLRHVVSLQDRGHPGKVGMHGRQVRVIVHLGPTQAMLRDLGL